MTTPGPVEPIMISSPSKFPAGPVLMLSCHTIDEVIAWAAGHECWAYVQLVGGILAVVKVDAKAE